MHLKFPLISMNQNRQELDALYLQVFHWRKTSPNSPSTSTSTEVEVVFPWHGRSCRALCQGGGGRKWLGFREKSSVACDVNVRYLKRGFFQEPLVLHNEYVGCRKRVLNYWMNAVLNLCIPEIGAPLIHWMNRWMLKRLPSAPAGRVTSHPALFWFILLRSLTSPRIFESSTRVLTSKSYWG